MSGMKEMSVGLPNQKIKQLQKRLNYTFKDEQLLCQALTRQKAIEEGAEGAALQSYQSLEFVGDAMLKACVVKVLYEKCLKSEASQLHDLAQEFIQNKKLSLVARRLKLEEYIIRGKSESEFTDKMLADALEAIIGAIFIDSKKGGRACQAFIEKAFNAEFKKVASSRIEKEIEQLSAIVQNEAKGAVIGKPYSNTPPLSANLLPKAPTFWISPEKDSFHFQKLEVIIAPPVPEKSQKGQEAHGIQGRLKQDWIKPEEAGWQSPASYELERQRKVAEAALKEAKGGNDIEVLLNYVVQGEQEKAEVLLKSNSGLASSKGLVTDLSKRTFKDVTAFQYAVWALDWHMWKMLLKYMPSEAAAMQLQELEDKGLGAYGKHFSLTPLIDALNTYRQKDWSSDQEETTYWCKQVGGAQLLLPVHVINEYCRPDRSFSSLPSFTEETLPRTRDLYSYGKKGDWFTSVYNGGSLGAKFGVYRSSEPWATCKDYGEKWGEKNWYTRESVLIEDCALSDVWAMQGLYEKRQQQLLSLKQDLLTKNVIEFRRR